MALIPKISFPIPANGTGRAFGNAEELLGLIEGESSGLYLVGSQGMWHGGIHITDTTAPWCALTGENSSELAYVNKPYPGEQAVSCMADGKIVAYRVCEDYDFIAWRGDKLYFSTSFVLVKHYIQPGENPSGGLTFHTLYMNLAPMSAYGQTDASLRETAKGQLYYSSQDEVNTGKAAGTLIAGTRVKLSGQVMTSARHHRQFCEVAVVNDTGSLKAGDKVWTVSDRGWLKPLSVRAEMPFWWAKCSPTYQTGTGEQQSYKTSMILKTYLSSEDISAGKNNGKLPKDFPVTVDARVPAFTRTTDNRIFSLVTLGKDNLPLKKGDRVWVVSDNDNLIAVRAPLAGEGKYGEVVVPETAIAISAGESIGHLGFYELPEENGKHSRYQVHIECLSADSKLPVFLTNPDKVGEHNPVYLKYAEGTELYMPDAAGKMVSTTRKSRAPGILTRVKVPGVDADGKALTDNLSAAYYQVRPEGGWMAAASMKKVAQSDLASLGFITLDKTPESFDLIDGIHHPDNVVKGILEELHKAAQNETDTSRALNQYNYDRLLKQIDTNNDGQYSEQEYLQAVHNPSYRDHLYRIIVKHPSEWYYGKDDGCWKSYLSTLSQDPSLGVWKAYTEAFIEKMKWMKQVTGMVGDPWHMHPVVFLDSIRDSESDEMDTKWLKVPKGQLTFNAEGNDIENSIYFSRHPHVPNNKGVVIGLSGITFGRGLDFGQQSKTYIQTFFKDMERDAKPLPSTLEKWLLGSVGFKGTAALTYCLGIDKHVPKYEQYLTRKQQHFLFNAVYKHLYNVTKRVISKGASIDGVQISAELGSYSQNVQDILVDLTFRGDNSPRTRQYFMKDLKSGESQFKSNMSNSHWRASFGVPVQRFNERKGYL